MNHKANKLNRIKRPRKILVHKHRIFVFKGSLPAFVLHFLIIWLFIYGSPNHLVSAKTQSDNDTPKEPPAQTADNPLLNTGVTSGLTNQFEQQLWQSRISTPKSQEHSKPKDELQNLIEKIRSIRFEKDQPTKVTSATIEPSLTAEPNEKIITFADWPQPIPERQPETTSDPRLPYKPVTEQTMRMLEELSRDPGKLHNPLALAEILFLSGHLKQAATFYRQALILMSLDDITSTENRAWVLFQIGNCLQNTDLSAAKKVYTQLITEHPDSLWADLAKARAKVIEWYQIDKPRQLINECGL
jgi:tetratricopeptide (TPR) repeat protein